MATLRRLGVPHPSEGSADAIAKELSFKSIGNNTYSATMTPRLFARRDDSHVRFLDAHIKTYLETEVAKKLKSFVAEVDFLRSQTAVAAAVVILALLPSRCAHDEQFTWASDLLLRNSASDPVIHPRDTILVEVEKQPTFSGDFVVRDDGPYTQPMVA